jgi:hypothetical protein
VFTPKFEQAVKVEKVEEDEEESEPVAKKSCTIDLSLFA